MRPLVFMITVVVWILIDKGNIYGQGRMEKDVIQKKVERNVTDSGFYKSEDSRDDPRPGGEEDESDHFTVKPNPVEQDLVFDFEFTVREGVPYEVFSPSGQLVAAGTLPPFSSNQSIDLSALPSGMYVLRLVIAEKARVRKIIKR